jgi:hypothetical protein
MAFTDATSPGQLLNTPLQSALVSPVQTYKARVTFGLRSRPLGSGTIEVTAGTDDTPNTIQATVNGVAISAVVEWVTSHAATAAALATSINANYASHNYVATVSSAVVTVMQRKSGAITGALAATVGGDVTATVVDFSGDTDTWTEFVSGATFDGALYYELSWSGALLTVAGFDASTARSLNVDLYCDGQALAFWVGGLRTAANVIVQGLPLATATWLHTTYGGYWPLVGSDYPFIVKVASDEELLYSVGVI